MSETAPATAKPSGPYGTLGSMKTPTLNIPELLMSIQLERVSNLDDQIKMQADEMSARNAWLKQARDVLTQLNNNRPTSEKPSDSNGKGPANYAEGKPITVTDKDGNSTELSVIEWAERNGIKLPAGDKSAPTQANYDSLISSVKSGMDTVNSQSQMDMVRLQSLMDKRNNGFDMLTNLISKTGKSLDSITGNMR